MAPSNQVLGPGHGRRIVLHTGVCRTIQHHWKCWLRRAGQNGAVHTEAAERDPEPEIRTLSSSVVYADNWARLRRDEIERSDGSKGTYAVVERDNFALVIPAGQLPEGRPGRHLGGAGAHRACPGDGAARRAAQAAWRAGRGPRYVGPVRRALAGHGAYAGRARP